MCSLLFFTPIYALHANGFLSGWDSQFITLANAFVSGTIPNYVDPILFPHFLSSLRNQASIPVTCIPLLAYITFTFTLRFLRFPPHSPIECTSSSYPYLSPILSRFFPFIRIHFHSYSFQACKLSAASSPFPPSLVLNSTPLCRFPCG